MRKRGNEAGQLSKDDFERLQDENESDPGQFQRANAEIMKRRRVVSASKSWSQGKVIKMPSAASTENSNKSVGVNPFASTVLAPSTSAASANPFASVSFAQTPKQPASNRPPVATSTKKTTISQTEPVSLSPNLMTERKLRLSAAEEENISMDERTKLLLSFAMKGNQEVTANPLSDYSSWMIKMVEKLNSFQGNISLIHSESKDPTPKFSFGNASSFSTSANNDSGNTSSKTSKFSFGNTNNEVSKPSQGFMFGSPSTATAVSEPKTFTGFSFSAPNANATQDNMVVPPPVATGNTQGDEEDGQLLDEPEEVLTATNDEDDELGCFEPVKFTRFDKSKNAYTSWISGVLRLYRTKATQKCKLVVRTKQVGKVMLNIEIYKDMVFKKEDIPKKKNIKQVIFMAMKDPEVGLEKFTIRIAATEVDAFVQKLEEMAK